MIASSPAALREGLVTSRDGTPIAFECSGRGPAVILVSSALADRSDTRRLARLLAEHFTVINYDRRGRGRSEDGERYNVARETEDIEALVNGAGGNAALFGSSSGAALALYAANSMPSKISRLVLYEPPFILDDSRPPVPDDLTREISRLLAEDRRADAVKLFMSAAMGIPSIGIFMMRFMPGWSAMTAMAHTIPYDLAILKGTQSGKPLPPSSWPAVSASTLILTGKRSEKYFHDAAKALTTVLPGATHQILQGQHHGSVAMGSKVLARAVTEYLAT